MINPLHAITILENCNINYKTDFHTLSSTDVDRLLEWADTCKYRKPKQANGSRGRYFFSYLKRRAGYY